MYSVLLGLGIVIALLFIGLVLLTGKGDAMSGGGGVRTTYKGKASFDDQMSQLTMILWGAFMIVTLAIAVAARGLG